MLHTSPRAEDRRGRDGQTCRTTDHSFDIHHHHPSCYNVSGLTVELINSCFSRSVAGNDSDGQLQLVRMQHASFLHRQRSTRWMRTSRNNHDAAAVARIEVPGAEAARLLAAALLSRRGQESRPRSLRADMPALCQTGHARHRALWPGRALR